MKKRKDLKVGLDVGTDQVRVLIAKSDPILSDSRLDILGIGTAPSRGLRKGVVINIEATVESISKALQDAQEMAGVSVRHATASISGAHIKSFTSNGIVGIRGSEVSQYDVNRVIDAAQAVALPVDRTLLHVIPQQFIIDGQDGVREPIGISGVRLETRAHLITASITGIDNLVKCASRCGIHLDELVFSGLASSTASLSAEEKELGVCLIDIGAGTTDVTVYYNGYVLHTFVIPIGGGHVTNDIAAGLRTPFLAAEEIKINAGHALAMDVSAAETLDVASTGGRANRTVSRMALAEIIEARMRELFFLVGQEMSEFDVADFLSSGIVLTGAGSKLPGLLELGEEVFGLPVRLGGLQGSDISKEISSKPELSSLIGLACYNLMDYSHVKLNGHGKMKRAWSGVTGWLGEHF